MEQNLRESDRRHSEAMNFIQADIIARESERSEKGEVYSREQFHRQAQQRSSQAQSAVPQPKPAGTTVDTVSRVRALFDFQRSEPGELQFRKGDVIVVLESVYKDWWKGSLRGQIGIFPTNYVEKLSDPTQEDLSREIQMEGNSRISPRIFNRVSPLTRALQSS
jgi:hypothetical protein